MPDTKILNQQELWIRILPTIKASTHNIKTLQEDKVILVRRDENLNPLYLKFKVNGIFKNVPQEEIYNSMVSPDLLEEACKGSGLIILAFGCIGTGKSYSITGSHIEKEYRGITPRIFESLFKPKYLNADREFMMSLIYIEIIGRDIFNLLEEGKPKVSCKVKPFYFHNLCEAMTAYVKGLKRRSNLGTTILTINVDCSYEYLNTYVTNKSKIHIIDMAGHRGVREDVRSLKCHREGNLTKSSISTICSWANDSLNTTVANWRSSMVAMYLGDSWSKSYIRLLGHIKVTNDSVLNTISTLNFGNRLIRLPGPKLVEEPIPSKMHDMRIQELKDELQEIKEAFIMKQITNNVFSPKLASKEERDCAMNLMTLYLNDELSTTKVVAECHPMLCLHAFKKIHHRSTVQLQQQLMNISKDISDLQYLKKKRNLDTESIMTGKSYLGVGGKKKKKKFSELKRPVEKNFEPSLLDFEPTGDVIEEEKNNAINTFKSIFQEFLNRHPDLRAKLNASTEKVAEYFRVRREDIQKINEIRTRLAEMPPADGESLEVTYLITDAQEAFRNSVARASSSNKNYLAVLKSHNELTYDIDLQFTDYLFEVYDSVFAIPPLYDS